VLTMMASAAMVAAVIYAFLPPEVPGLEWNPLLTGLLLLGVCLAPLLPGVFNLVVGRLAERFQHMEDFRVPRLGVATLILGLAAAAVAWGILGVSAWALWRGVLPEAPALTVDTWARFNAAVALSFVAGFLVLVTPSGVGVREYFLLHLLAFTGAEPLVAVAVLLLRVVWTAAEVVAGAICLALGRAKAALAAPVLPDLEPVARDTVPPGPEAR
jgi:glycosyltransferase 2 family protein